ncbi:MAG TPA: hypothetical protein VGM75_25325 [Pseudonocardiaceae bacterium]|jgi:hypothetical protein
MTQVENSRTAPPLLVDCAAADGLAALHGALLGDDDALARLHPRRRPALLDLDDLPEVC